MPSEGDAHNGMRDVSALAHDSSDPFGGVTARRKREHVGACRVVALERETPREQRLARGLNPLERVSDALVEQSLEDGEFICLQLFTSVTLCGSDGVLGKRATAMVAGHSLRFRAR